jgi:hypothetical protein
MTDQRLFVRLKNRSGGVQAFFEYQLILTLLA